jgi:hypothetical protein
MRLRLAMFLLAFLPATIANAEVHWWGVTGNDTGGVLPWSPEVAHIYRGIADAHCARWNRIARITSVHRRYGEFVAFVCLNDRSYDPRKEWWLYWHGY